MSALSWNELRRRAFEFSKAWSGDRGGRAERAEAQTFWNEFFDVFGVRRRAVASFEEPVRGLGETYGRIDLFWKGRLLAEHKSAGESLEKARSQAFRYVQDLARSGRPHEIPRYVLLSDFARIVLIDLEPERGAPESVEIPVARLAERLDAFAFLTGRDTRPFVDEDEANLRAAGLMADLHDAVDEGTYSPEALERLLVRLLFCLFADDTGLFSPGEFELFLRNRTREDGSDLGPQLNALFDVLDTPVERRSRHLDEDLLAFPFVNGGLFADRLPVAGFSAAMRERLLEACRFDWARISPAIFGSLFQGIMDPRERRNLGAHYTSEKDILKVLGPLFLDELREELGRILADRSTRRRDRLEKFQAKLASMNFLDPACGCGNFLVVAYRELRRLEFDAMKALHGDFAKARLEAFDSDEVMRLSAVDVDQFFGIEIGEWPARIAETALWITDHQMNLELSRATGNLFQRIPLRKAPGIRIGNALRIDWNDVLPASRCSYVMGNPPFIGGKFQNREQKADVKRIAGAIPSHGLLDYVTMWYLRAADYARGTPIRCAFVSTNSIAQGEQPGVLWPELFRRGMRIQFAHRPFSWDSEASGKAHVHVVIVGFGPPATSPAPTIHEEAEAGGASVSTIVSGISPYLVEGGDLALTNRSRPLCDVPLMKFGNQPIDGGHLILDAAECRRARKEHPEIRPYLKRYVGAKEFIQGEERWCLWLHDADPAEVRRSSFLRERIEAVRAFRRASERPATVALASEPSRFAFATYDGRPFLLVPSVSSETRRYIPMGFMSKNVVASNLCLVVPGADHYLFGVLTSRMHMAWVRATCGRMKSDYRYSIKLVYNNFPWPLDPSPARRAKVEECARAVLETRKSHQDRNRRTTLADLYDPLTMPRDLLAAHRALDRAVERCYRAEPFPGEDDRPRIEFLFRLHERLVSPLAPGGDSDPSGGSEDDSDRDGKESSTKARTGPKRRRARSGEAWSLRLEFGPEDP